MIRLGEYMNIAFELKNYRRDCQLGALGALLMMIGDLCLSIIPASPGDSGLFLREAYLSGAYGAWRLPLLTATGLIGMALGFFTVRATCARIRPQYARLRRAVLLGGVIYVSSAAALHFFIGSLADWTSTLSPLLGRDEAAALISAAYGRIMPAMGISYAGMVLWGLGDAYAVLANKTVLPRRMFVFHMLAVQLVMALIPDVRQTLDAQVSTWDFVLSQGSGNAGLLIWMAANARWADRQIKMKEANSHE